MRIRYKVNATIDEGNDGRNMILAPEDAAAEVILDGPQEASVVRVHLDAAATLVVPFGSITSAQGLYIKSSGDFNLNINGNIMLPVRRGVAAASGGLKASIVKFFFEGTITNVSLTASESLTLTAAIWGDSAP